MIAFYAHTHVYLCAPMYSLCKFSVYPVYAIRCACMWLYQSSYACSWYNAVLRYTVDMCILVYPVYTLVFIKLWSYIMPLLMHPISAIKYLLWWYMYSYNNTIQLQCFQISLLPNHLTISSLNILSPPS